MKPVLWFAPAVLAGLLLSLAPGPAAADGCGAYVAPVKAVKSYAVQSYATQAYATQTYAQTYAVAPVVAVYQPVVLAVPVYAAGYVAPPAPAPAVAAPAPAQTAPAVQAPAQNDQLTELLGKIDARLQVLEQRGSRPAHPYPQQPPAYPPVQPPPAQPPTMPPATPPPTMPPADPFNPDGPQTRAPARHPAAALMAARCASCHDQAAADREGGGVALFKGRELMPWPPKTRDRVIAGLSSGRMPKGSKMTEAEIDRVVAFVDGMK